ncbi:cupin domain-containing protein [Allobranchiibius huperziae]|uniref:Mannose-6-phosphate isomerase-like protein (Cupin superfamily) n=1 Tax=Allobranchiibius huperziae TaxID=1874116 RepID=A0A853DIG7_9MICO|nr:cupin domain-containing protein [Allobranchiibius huperziae]NYJ74520.1 mannose-6-phosphate isomerase-like protein (cupin superfamily) [Allobranchiibius huperziae]
MTQSTDGGSTPRRQVEVTPGDVFQLGLPWVLQNQSLFNFWNVRSGDYFVELEGEHYGWDNSTVQVTETGPGFGPPLHQHPTEEVFVLAEGEAAFVSGDDIHYMKAPAIVRVPPHTTHNVTTLGQGRNKLVTFFSSNTPGASPVELHDPFAHIKDQSSAERDTMIANFKKVLEDFDDDGDGRLSYAEAPLLIKAQFGRYDTDQDGFITLEDAEGWD